MINFQDLRTLERGVIEVIRTTGSFYQVGSLIQAVNHTSANPNSLVRGSKIDLHLGFTLPTKLREDGNKEVERMFHIGCLAVKDDSNDHISQLSYSVLIDKGGTSEKAVERKFHFDFEPSSNPNRSGEPKPSHHLQMCGCLSDYHVQQGYEDEHIKHLYPSLSKPRIPTQPTSLALLLNWLFIEFGSNNPSILIAQKDHRWRKIVREAEKQVLYPYYKECADFFSSHANDNMSFTDAKLYEKGTG
ncbi:MAG: hypothetical protein H6R05_173 [Burkholderiaceae bacterium]|nr:hypothetical protein [Burkholderiaceae bacterium]